MSTIEHLFENNKKWADQITAKNPHFCNCLLLIPERHVSVQEVGARVGAWAERTELCEPAQSRAALPY